MKRIWIVVAASCALALGILGARAVARDLATPRDLHDVAYRTSGDCQRCHPSHYDSWARTFHSKMTQEASERAVVGDFDGASFEYGGVTARMEHGPDGYTMRFYGEGGLLSSARVVRTVGSRRVQQYLAQDGDVLFRLPVAWHIEEQRWIHMNGAFLTPDPELPIAREDYHRHVVRWNDNCVFCHNVAPSPGLDRERGRFETEVAELGIACEACHGPGEEHVRANADPTRRYALHLTDGGDPTIVNPARLSAERSAEVCGRCHGQRITEDIDRFMRHGDPFVPGEELSRYSAPIARDTPLNGDPDAFAPRFWPDGTARLTAYEYQGLLASSCGGLTCTSCHGMHEGDPRGQIRPALEGDAMCTACHEELASIASAREHARHDDVRCADCHMPRIVYGLIDVHRSHRIDSPDPSAPRPDACTLCHAEETRAWAITERERLWPTERVRTADPSALPEVARAAIAGDPIERAVACAALGRDDALSNEQDRARRLGVLLDVMLEDPYPAVRRIAWRSARALVPDAGVRWNDYAATDGREPRERFVRRLRPRAIAPSAEITHTLRAQAAQVAIEIGE